MTHPMANCLRSGKASGTSYTTPNCTEGSTRHAAGLEKIGILKISLLWAAVHGSHAGRHSILVLITNPIPNCLRSGKASGTSYTTSNFAEGSARDAPGV